MKNIALSKALKKLNKFNKINIGCGETKLKGFINIDVEKKVLPDLIWDVTRRTLPFKSNSIIQLNCIHNLEHIPIKSWDFVLRDFYRVLKLGGELILAYPEFEVCSKYFLSNHHNEKKFWAATLYGRQLYKGDFHVTPMVTKDIIQLLQQIGFDNFRYRPEVGEEYNTFMVCEKRKVLTREDVVRKEVFGK